MHNIRRNCLLLLLVGFWKLSLADVFEQCNAENDQHFIASNKSCTHFILCNGEESYEGECGDGDYFNSQQEMCELMRDIDCRTGQSIQTDGTGTNVQATETVTIAPGESTTIIPTTGVSPASNVSVSIISQLPAVNTSFTDVWSNQVVTIVASSCPRTDSPSRIVLLAHDKSCTDYFICYNGKPLAMHCAAMLHFNAKTGKCDMAEIVKCMTSAISVREQCKKHTVDIYPHPDNCNYFYYCLNGYLMLQQCPFFYGWDYEKRSCVAIRQAKCFGRARI